MRTFIGWVFVISRSNRGDPVPRPLRCRPGVACKCRAFDAGNDFRAGRAWLSLDVRCNRGLDAFPTYKQRHGRGLCLAT
jgi:hypothetical protein